MARRSNYTYLILDISGRNIAFTSTNLLDTTEEQLFKILRCPEIKPLARINGTPLDIRLPTQLVKAADWVDKIDKDDEEIRLLDVRESFLQGEEPKKLAQLGALRVPETIFTSCFDYRVDQWRSCCLVREILRRRSIYSETH